MGEKVSLVPLLFFAKIGSFGNADLWVKSEVISFAYCKNRIILKYQLMGEKVSLFPLIFCCKIGSFGNADLWVKSKAIPIAFFQKIRSF